MKPQGGGVCCLFAIHAGASSRAPTTVSIYPLVHDGALAHGIATSQIYTSQNYCKSNEYDDRSCHPIPYQLRPWGSIRSPVSQTRQYIGSLTSSRTRCPWGSILEIYNPGPWARGSQLKNCISQSKNRISHWFHTSGTVFQNSRHIARNSRVTLISQPINIFHKPRATFRNPRLLHKSYINHT